MWLQIILKCHFGSILCSCGFFWRVCFPSIFMKLNYYRLHINVTIKVGYPHTFPFDQSAEHVVRWKRALLPWARWVYSQHRISILLQYLITHCASHRLTFTYCTLFTEIHAGFWQDVNSQACCHVKSPTDVQKVLGFAVEFNLCPAGEMEMGGKWRSVLCLL